MIHQAHFFRNPALVAKMAATVDLISGGRFIYFVDVGFSRHEYAAYGLPWQDAYEDRFASMIEGLQVTLKLWGAEKPVSFDGQFYQVKEAVCTPLPIQRPHPPVWLGEAHPLTMEGAARYAQGWNSVPVRREELQRRLDALAAACGAIGRPVEEIEKSLEIQILIAPDHDAIRSRLKAITALTPPGANIKPQADLLAFVNGESDTLPSSLTDTSIVGTPDEVRTQVEGYIKMGFTHFMLWFMDAPSEDGLRLFAEATAPHFKAS
jgi:alkanesulfonate monooxygenase SsuD/methylene tetrahydromethanopterin reductase-like flavin-dependent oxidoreductase (luciferase family)